MTSAEATPAAPAGSRWGRARSWAGPALLAALVALGGWLLYRAVGRYDYAELTASMAAVPPARLAAAAGFAAASYLTLAGGERLALAYVKHPLPFRYVLMTSFISLAMGHNIGFAALSSGAIRYRFYSRAGLSMEEIAKIIVFCGLTVIMGLTALAGVALVVHPAFAAKLTGFGPGAVRAAAALLFAAALAYVALAAFLRGRLRVWRWTLELPPARLAAAQIAIGMLNFALVAACLHQIVLGVAEIPYLAVASAYVLANTATIVSHVPGGLGVIENVVLLVLQEPRLIGAVLVFRAVYFLLPLALGGVLFAAAEAWFRAAKRRKP
jgi:uncharacterized membrane protein YbhN (UPF0104 family)